MIIKSAQFVTSVADANKIPTGGDSPEIALCGRSNVGKSSFVNYIAGQNRLAKTSKEPGRTRLINYFSINQGELTLVDLPGYGFAKVAESEKRKWGNMIEGYLKNSPNLKNVFLLLDIRRDPNEDDVMMINYLYHYAISFTVIATKMDKVSRSEGLKRIRDLAAKLKIGVGNILPVSSYAKTGKEGILNRFDEILEASKLAPEIAEDE